MSKPRVLFVDDEPNILNAFRRQLHKHYAIHIAQGGPQALEIISQNKPFAVIITDMRMPEMDGVEFLKHVNEVSPDSTRLMLTGNADQQTAIDAVNEGHVFRFLNKPCSVSSLTQAVDAAIEQHNLITAEKELLEGTVNGSITLLTEILSLVAPIVFGRVSSLRDTAIEVARALRQMDTWNMEMATMLSQISYVTIPEKTLVKIYKNEKLKPMEKKIRQTLPEISCRVLEKIPRLDKIANIVKYQQKNYNGTGFPDDNIAGEDIPLESRILKVLHDLHDLIDCGINKSIAIQTLKKQMEKYDPKVLDTISWFYTENEMDANELEKKKVKVLDLKPGHVLIQPIENMNDLTLLTAGLKLSPTIIESLKHFLLLGEIREPISILEKKTLDTENE